MSDEDVKEAKPKRRTRSTASKKNADEEKEEGAAEVKEEPRTTKDAKKTRTAGAKKATTRRKKASAEKAEPEEQPVAEAAPVEKEALPPQQPAVAERIEALPLVKLKYRKGTSSYAHMRSFRKKAYSEALGRTQWSRLIEWRKQGTITPVDNPTRLDRARALGYKAKQGVTVVRVRVRRGGLRKRKISKGRRARRKGILKITMKKSIQRIAEERVQKHYPNMEVLNSYQVGQDGLHKWYEVILVDPYNPSVLSDRKLNWISDPAHSSRAYRGLTAAGKRGRGLRWKGKGAEKVRPSIRANDRKGK